MNENVDKFRGIKQTTVLVLDANFSTLPIVLALQSKGYFVICCGNLASDPCHRISDKSIILDYSNKDALLAEVERIKPDYLVSGCNDISYISASWIAEKLKYPGYDSYNTTCVIHDKVLFRSLCRSKNYPSPRSATTEDQALELQLPVLLKPNLSFSGKGIERIETVNELRQAIDRLHKLKVEYVIEEFIEGDLFSHSAFIRDGEIITDFFVHEYCTVYPYQVNSSHVSVGLSEIVMYKARCWLKQFSKDLELVNGLVHTQFLSDGDSFSVLEVCRRCPGDLYSLLIQKSTNADYAWLFVSGFVQQKPTASEIISKPRYVTRHTVTVDYNCIYLGSKLTIDCLHSVNYQLKKCGEKLLAAPYDKAGIYFIEHSNAEKMKKLTIDTLHFVDIESIVVGKSL